MTPKIETSRVGAASSLWVRKQAFAQAFEEEKDFTGDFLCCFGMLWKKKKNIYIYIHMFLQKFPVLDSILAWLEKTNQDMAVQSDFRKVHTLLQPLFFTATQILLSCVFFKARYHHPRSGTNKAASPASGPDGRLDASNFPIGVSCPSGCFRKLWVFPPNHPMFNRVLRFSMK